MITNQRANLKPVDREVYMSEMQKRFVLENKNIAVKVLSEFLGVSYHAVYAFKRYLQLNSATSYNGCGVPRDRRIR